MKQFNRILSMVLVIAMVMSIAVLGVVAEGATTMTPAEFIEAVGKGGTVELPENCIIDFDGYEFTKAIEVLAGTTIEGNGATLINVNVGSVGLFNLAACNSADNKATFKNFQIGEDGNFATASGTSSAGAALIYQTNNAYTSVYTEWIGVSIYATLTIVSSSDTGVFFGRIGGTHNFTNCNVTVAQNDVQANAFGAYLGRSNTGSETFTGCTANGAIINGKNIGGFIGKVKSATFIDCVNNVSLTSTGGSGNGAGGFVGMGESGTVPAISNCTNNGIVVATSSNVVTGHFYGQAEVTDTVTGLKSVPSNVEELEVNGVTYQTIHNYTDLSTKLKTTGNYILAQNIDLSGLTAAAVVADGVVLEGYGMAFLNADIQNQALAIFDLSTNNTTAVESVTFKNFTVGTPTKSVKANGSVMVADATADSSKKMMGSVWENITVYAQIDATAGTLTANKHHAVFSRYPGDGDGWTFNNVHVYVDVLTKQSGAFGGFFGRFHDEATFIDCSVNNLSESGVIQNKSQNAGGYIGKLENGHTVAFTNCFNYADFNTQDGSGNGVGGFIGLTGTATVTFTDCVNAGSITDTNAAPVGGMIGNNSATVTVNSFINVGSLTHGASGSYATETEKMVYNGTTYTIDSATKQIVIDGTPYTVLATPDCFAKLNAVDGKFVLFADINMGTVTAPYAVADGVELDGNNHSLTNLILEGKAFLFTFEADTTASFKNLTIGSESAPVDAWAAVISYTYSAEDVDPELDGDYLAKQEEADALNAPVGAFNTNWENVDIYATLNHAGNVGAFFGGNLDGTHTFTNCNATVSLAEGTTKQGNQVGAFIGRNKSGDVAFVDCTANGTIAASVAAGGFIAKCDANASFEGCENKVSVTSAADAAGFIGTIGMASVITVVDCVNSGNVTVSTSSEQAAGFIATSPTDAKQNTIFIADSRNIGAVSGGQAGGFISSASATITIRACVNEGKITSSTNQATGFVVGDSLLTVEISDSINMGDIESSTWAAGFIRRVGFATLTNCVNIGNISASSKTAGAAVQFVAAMQSVDNASHHSVTITNCYALAESVTGFVVGDFINPDFEEDSRVTLADNYTAKNDRYNERFNEDGTLDVFKGYQLSVQPGEGIYDQFTPDGYDAPVDIYSVRLLAGIDSADYESVVVYVKMNIGDWTDGGVEYTIKTLYEKVTVSQSDMTTAAAASDYYANYFAAVAITQLPVGVDATFEVSVFVTENGVTYQLGATETTEAINGPEPWVATPAN